MTAVSVPRPTIRTDPRTARRVFALIATLIAIVLYLVFLSIIVGGGLMAASYFSDKSGHDQSIDDSTRTYRDEKRD